MPTDSHGDIAVNVFGEMTFREQSIAKVMNVRVERLNNLLRQAKVQEEPGVVTLDQLYQFVDWLNQKGSWRESSELPRVEFFKLGAEVARLEQFLAHPVQDSLIECPAGTISLLVDPGQAAAADIADLLSEISKLYEMLGGKGIQFTVTDVRTPEFSGVAQ